MTIRPIRRSEIPLLTDFLYEAIFQGGGAPLPRTVIQHPALWRYVDRFGSRRHDHCLVAEQEGVIVGAVWVRRMHGFGFHGAATPEMAVAVYPQWRGQGTGTSLVAAMLQLLHREGYTAVPLSAQRANHVVRRCGRAGISRRRKHGRDACHGQKATAFIRY